MEEEITAGGAAPPPPATSPPRETPADLVERWWNEHFPGSPVAQVTAAWNHAFAAKEELKVLLRDG